MLDDLSGFEFEDTMSVVFEKLGYEDVEVAVQVADEGRDIIMTESNSDGTETAVIVECKHTAGVSRPVIQKLDSAVRTYDFDGPTRGMIATTGRLTKPAREYAERVDIEVIDGRRLREIADDVGMDIYNGRIEIVCEETLDPIHPDGPAGPISSSISDIENLSVEDLPALRTWLTLIPAIAARVHARSEFSTSVGVVHRVDDRMLRVIDASRGAVSTFPTGVPALVARYLDDTQPIDLEGYETMFDTVHERRFDRTETEYREWLTQDAIDRYTQTVSYTGDNNVTYEKVCEPSPSDISIEWIEPVHVPRIRATVAFDEQDYGMDWFAASGDTVVAADSFHECRVCRDFGEWTNTDDLAGIRGALGRVFGARSYTFCANCSRIACQAHIRTERRTGEPVCTGCALDDRYLGATKFFSDAESKEAFNDEFVEMGWPERVRENRAGLIASVLLVLFLLLALI